MLPLIWLEHREEEASSFVQALRFNLWTMVVGGLRWSMAFFLSSWSKPSRPTLNRGLVVWLCGLDLAPTPWTPRAAGGPKATFGARGVRGLVEAKIPNPELVYSQYRIQYLAKYVDMYVARVSIHSLGVGILAFAMAGWHWVADRRFGPPLLPLLPGLLGLPTCLFVCLLAWLVGCLFVCFVCLFVCVIMAFGFSLPGVGQGGSKAAASWGCWGWSCFGLPGCYLVRFRC